MREDLRKTKRRSKADELVCQVV
uniref:Uncharacterized protein n=1 Tax=Rhizophora mucronata TaxID=61149 RepID=A0A2P2IRK3_RHIMU